MIIPLILNKNLQGINRMRMQDQFATQDMEDNRIEIMICLGSSCFSRGNKKTVDTIKQFITDKHLEEKVYFHGGHCFSGCENGPKIMIAGKVYEHVDHNNVIDLMVRTFDHLI